MLDDASATKLAQEMLTEKGELVFPGIEGTPYLLFEGESVPDVREGDTERLRPQYQKDIHVNIFRLWDDEDMEQYRKIIQLVGKDRAKLSCEEREFVKENNSWIVFLRWFIPYVRSPLQVKREDDHGRVSFASQ